MVSPHDRSVKRPSRYPSGRLARALSNADGSSCAPSRLAEVMRRRETQTVQPEFLELIQVVLDKILPYCLLLIGDGRPPGRARPLPKEARNVLAEIVSLRPEVIVYNIEKHHQSVAVGRIDERLEAIRRAIGGVRSKLQDAIIAPSPNGPGNGRSA